MSADNQMVVAPCKSGQWYTYMQLGDYPYTRKQAKTALFYQVFETKEKAVEYASKVCEEEIVEYGIRIDGR